MENKIPVLTECSFRPLEIFNSEMVASNVYVGEDNNKKKAFMIQISIDQLTNELIDEVSSLRTISNNHQVLKIKSIFRKSQNEIYLVSEYSEGIPINKFINYTDLPVLTRFLLLKQMLNILVDIKRCGIKVHEYNSDFCFVQNIEEPQIVLLYNFRGVIDSQKNLTSNNANKVMKNCDFCWISNSIFMVTRIYKSKADQFKTFFERIKTDALREKAKSLFTKSFNKCKGEEKNFTLEEFKKELDEIIEGIENTQPQDESFDQKIKDFDCKEIEIDEENKKKKLNILTSLSHQRKKFMRQPKKESLKKSYAMANQTCSENKKKEDLNSSPSKLQQNYDYHPLIQLPSDQANYPSNNHPYSSFPSYIPYIDTGYLCNRGEVSDEILSCPMVNSIKPSSQSQTQISPSLQNPINPLIPQIIYPKFPNQINSFGGIINNSFFISSIIKNLNELENQINYQIKNIERDIKNNKIKTFEEFLNEENLKK